MTLEKQKQSTPLEKTHISSRPPPNCGFPHFSNIGSDHRWNPSIQDQDWQVRLAATLRGCVWLKAFISSQSSNWEPFFSGCWGLMLLQAKCVIDHKIQAFTMWKGPSLYNLPHPTPFPWPWIQGCITTRQVAPWPSLLLLQMVQVTPICGS